MPVSPTPDESYYWEIANAYKDAELEILGQIRDRLDKGQSLSDQAWQTARLAEIQVMRREATKVLAGVNQSQASKISGAFGNAYKDGELSALKDTAAFLPGKPSAVSSAARRASVAALARKTSSGVAGVMPSLLRTMEDDYRKVVKSSVARVAAGGVDRRAATSRALAQAFGMGLKTGPDGKMNLPDYITMAMRTGTANALIQGHMDSLEENGLDLVMIHPGPRTCKLCDGWANKPLYRKTGKPGVHLFDSEVTLKKVKVDVAGTLNDAKAAGWGHPNCRCGVGAYIPGVSLAQERPPWDKDEYEAQQKQRVAERHIREWKTREALTTGTEQLKARAKVAAWQAAIRLLLDTHPELKRQSHRESIKGTFGPKYNGPTEAPKPPSKPKTGPKTSPKTVDPEPLVMSPVQEWATKLLAGNPELPAGPIQKILNPEMSAQVKAVALNDLYKNGWITKLQYNDALDALDGVPPVVKVVPPTAPKKAPPVKAAVKPASPLQELYDAIIEDYPELKGNADLAAAMSGSYTAMGKLIDNHGVSKVYAGDFEEIYSKMGYDSSKYATVKFGLDDKPTPQVLKPEQPYIDDLIKLLEDGTYTEATLKAAMAKASDLGKLNGAEALKQWKAKVKAGTAPEKAPKVSPRPSKDLGPSEYTWDGKSKPKAPEEPTVPKSDKVLKLDAWLDKVKAKYAAFAKATNNPKSTLEQSNNWNYVQQALAGDTAAIKYLHQNKYLDDALRDEALEAIKDVSRLDPAVEAAYKSAMATYGRDLAQYKLDLAKYRKDNGITSAAQGFEGAVRHTSDQEGVKWAYANLNSPSKTSPAGKAATRYSGNAYDAWNAALRGTKPGELPAGTYKTATKQLDDGMTPMPTNLVVHRGTDFKEFLGLGDLLPPPPPMSLIGKAYRNDGYASTSVGTQAAFQYKPVQLEIMVPKGHKAMNVMPVSRYGDAEREVLLSRGTTYFVHDVWQDGSKWRIRVEVVPDGEDPSLWEPIPRTR